LSSKRERERKKRIEDRMRIGSVELRERERKTEKTDLRARKNSVGKDSTNVNEVELK